MKFRVVIQMEYEEAFFDFDDANGAGLFLASLTSHHVKSKYEGEDRFIEFKMEKIEPTKEQEEE